ncbi:MAG TPA: hypothetical protein PKK96_14375 [Anaerolineales bacterium]|nr:hypothetical protein [Anaerolineales bacterium]HNQ96138.1 hypothetical protein [Anaerolineales bacterium]HNS62187.1 hypothetical protein [Anaerolineales bacterium]
MRKAKKIFHPSNRYDLADYDERVRFLIGWPGYRTARNRSGLGYAETQAELGHMQGLFIRWLVTGKFRTHNPIYLFFLAVGGMMYGGIPFLLILHEVFIANKLSYLLLLLLQPGIIFGLLVMVNALLSLFDWKGPTITGE